MNATAVDESLSLTAPTTQLTVADRLGLVLVGLGLLALLVLTVGAVSTPVVWLYGGLGSLTGGALLFFGRHLRKPPGIRNDGQVQSSVTGLGAAAWVLGVVFTGVYILLYWFPWTLEHLIRAFDPMSEWIRGRAADQWFMYGFFYTMAVVVMGVRAYLRYRHSRYHVIRTTSVIFFQLGFAFILPSILLLLNEPEFYFHYFWPLKYDYLWPGTVESFSSASATGVFMMFWGVVMIAIATPVLTYFFGKRWYCSWVCGCGALAETAGDPWRHLSDKSLKAWKVERWMVHGVLVLIIVTTALLWINSALGGAVLGGVSGVFAQSYGFYIGLIFSGVIGVGFYPVMGARVWCRFGCPMAAILGLQQRFFSRFRITTNGGQCISCGNCSTYCEMGIDVRWYAQRGQNVIRASCVGCGMCATVCPRGVLKLENGPREGRYNGPVLFERDALGILDDPESTPTVPNLFTSSQ